MTALRGELRKRGRPRRDRNASPGDYDEKLDCLECGHAKEAHGPSGCLVYVGPMPERLPPLYCACTSPDGVTA